MKLTTAYFWALITSVSCISIGAIDLRTGFMLRLAPVEVWFVMCIIIFVGTVANIFIAATYGDTGALSAPKLPNLASTIKAKVFPPPYSMRRQYANNQRRVRKEVTE